MHDGRAIHARQGLLATIAVNDAETQTRAWEAQAVPLPSHQAEIDFQKTSSLRQAHVIAQKLNNAVLLYYRDVSSHGWRDTTYFSLWSVR